MAESMHPRRISVPTRKPIQILILAAAVLGQVGCGTIDVESRWRDFPIAIDGRSGDWGDALVRFKDTDIALGVANDAEALFLCLDAGNGDRPVPFMQRGLVLWVDAKGGKSREYGLRFPIGLDVGALRRNPVDPEDRAAAQAHRREMMAETRDEVEIIGPGDVEPRRVKISDLKGLEISAKNAGGRFVYEVRIPLSALDDLPFAVGSTAGRKIGLGLEIPESDSTYRRPGMGSRGGGGFGGMRGGMMGGRMGGGRGGRGAGLQNFSVWAKVKLAAGPVAPRGLISGGPSLSSRPQPD